VGTSKVIAVWGLIGGAVPVVWGIVGFISFTARSAPSRILGASKESGMAEVRLVGWSKGLKVVSLIQAMIDQPGIRLPEAKSLVEELLAGRSIAVSFTDAAQADAFRELASRLGAQCE